MSTPASIAPAQGVGRVAIIGAGSVGSTCAYALLLRRVVSEILLVDIDTNLLNAQVQDLNDAAFLSNTRIGASTFPEAGQCDLIVVTAGAKQHEGESRRDLIERNYSILGNVIQDMSPIRGDAVLLLVSNPVDVLTDYAQKISGLPKTQVFGSGTFLDSVRLRSALAEQTQVCTTHQTYFSSYHKFQVAYTAVHAYVLGEHGDSQMVRPYLRETAIRNLISPSSGRMVQRHNRLFSSQNIASSYLPVSDRARQLRQNEGLLHHRCQGRHLLRNSLYRRLHLRDRSLRPASDPTCQPLGRESGLLSQSPCSPRTKRRPEDHRCLVE
jgi:hypothetical protein